MMMMMMMDFCVNIKAAMRKVAGIKAHEEEKSLISNRKDGGGRYRAKWENAQDQLESVGFFGASIVALQKKSMRESAGRQSASNSSMWRVKRRRCGGSSNVDFR